MHAKHASASVWARLGLCLLSGLAASSTAIADQNIRAVVSEHRSDGTLVVQTDTMAGITVVFNEGTKVHRVDGMRTSRVEKATLVPGLRVRIAGEFESVNRFVAERVSYSRSDLKTAQAIAAGVTSTEQRSVANQDGLQEHAMQLQAHQQALNRQGRDISATKQRIDANERNILGAAAALESTNARISNLHNYDVVKTVTVYFANGKAKVKSGDQKQLRELAAETQGGNGYVVQVQGYASAVGAEARNQELSAQRADAVVAILQQSGVPTTSIVVPAAMGVSQQVASNKSRKGQAENRRTVVTLLQNKGIGDEP